jgi:hypothetical protein
VDFLTAEFFLTKFHQPNGGAIILVRTVWTSIWAFMILLGFYNFFEVIDERRLWEWDWTALRSQIRSGVKWWAALFGATYAGLYTRYSSQWTYLADTYNQIKAAECANIWAGKPLAEWKAGFIEDAEALHLATKPTIAPTISAWMEQRSVQEAFDRYSPGGAARRECLAKRVNTAMKKLRHRSYC